MVNNLSIRSLISGSVVLVSIIFPLNSSYAGNCWGSACFGCDGETVDGQLAVPSDGIKMLDLSRNEVSLPQGNYKADIEFIEDNKAFHMMVEVDRQSEVFHFQIGDSKFLRTDGTYNIASNVLEQPFDMTITRKTSVVSSPQKVTARTCIIDYLPSVYGPIFEYGAELVKAHTEKTTVYLGFDFLVPGKATLSTSDTTTQTVVDEVLEACHN